MAKTKKKEEAVVTHLSDLKDETYISTGVKELDEMITGFARGRITEVWGNPGIGKSYLLAKTMSANEGTTLYCDSEFSLVKQRLIDLGVDINKVEYVQDGRLETVTERILEAVGAFDLIILDSLAKLVPMTVETSEVGTNAIGLFARQVKHFEAKLKPILATSKTAFVVINQARAGMGSMAPAKPQGGFAWEHAIDIRIKLSKPLGSKQEHVIKGQKVFTGHIVQATVEKSRLTPPYLSTKFLINYREENK